MATMMDYLDWRGDLPLTYSPFNEVDNLILAQISYVALDGIAPAPGEPPLTLAQAARRYFACHTDEDVNKLVSFTKTAAFLLRKAGTTQRLGGVRLCAYVNEIDFTGAQQFSAMCFVLPDATVYVAYRGTDDTLVGWKEDFNMSFTAPVPAQTSAVRYLEAVAGIDTLPCALRLGGHSKGGNLAVYAAVHATPAVRARITAVYNNDGPGFTDETLESAAYQNLRPRIRSIVPQSSVVGMLLEHIDAYSVVRSTQAGLMQHDAMTWCVRGTEFETVDEIDAGARLLDDTLHAWIGSMSPEQRETFVELLFGALDATEAKTLGELKENAWQSLSGIAHTLSHLSKEDKAHFSEMMRQLMAASKGQIYRRIAPRLPEALTQENTGTTVSQNTKRA